MHTLRDTHHTRNVDELKAELDRLNNSRQVG